MELATNHEGMFFYFCYFNQITFRKDSGGYKPVLFQFFAEMVIVFIAMSVAFVDRFLTVKLKSSGVFGEFAGICSQP